MQWSPRHTPLSLSCSDACDTTFLQLWCDDDAVFAYLAFVYRRLRKTLNLCTHIPVLCLNPDLCASTTRDRTLSVCCHSSSNAIHILPMYLRQALMVWYDTASFCWNRDTETHVHLHTIHAKYLPWVESGFGGATSSPSIIQPSEPRCQDAQTQKFTRPRVSTAIYCAQIRTNREMRHRILPDTRNASSWIFLFNLRWLDGWNLLDYECMYTQTGTHTHAHIHIIQTCLMYMYVSLQW